MPEKSEQVQNPEEAPNRQELFRKAFNNDAMFDIQFSPLIFLENSVIVRNLYEKNSMSKKWAVPLMAAYDGHLPEIIIDRKRVEAEAAAAGKGDQGEAAPAEKPPGAVILRFPKCNNISEQAAPNILLRSAIFTATMPPRNKIRYIEDETLPIPSQRTYSIQYSGPQLTQTDFDTWLHAAHLAGKNKKGLGVVCRFTYYSFVKSMGKNTSGEDTYLDLKKRLKRLHKAGLEVKDKGSGEWKEFRLIEDLSGNDNKKEIAVKFRPEILELFYNKDWTPIELAHRKKLRGKPTALWLHGYYSSHKNPLPVKVQTLYEWSGSQAKSIRGFTKTLRAAFKNLEQFGIHGEVKKGFVYVEHK